MTFAMTSSQSDGMSIYEGYMLRKDHNQERESRLHSLLDACRAVVVLI